MAKDIEIPIDSLIISKDFEIEDYDIDQKGRMSFSGYASTNALDLENEIIEAYAWEKDLHHYKKNPIICYNHDPRYPYGRALKVSITDLGLHFDEIVLDPVPFVKDNLWPLIKSGTLSKMRVGFSSLEAERDQNGVIHHTRTRLFENSVVSIPANYDASIDSTGKYFGQCL